MKMNRIMLLCLAFVLVVATAALAADLPVVFSEGFEAGKIGDVPAGWEKVARSGSNDIPLVTEEEAHSGSKSLKVFRQPKSFRMTNGVSIAFAPLKERAVVSFWMRATDLERSLVFSLLGEEQGNAFFGPSAGPFMVLRNGAVQAYDTTFRDLALYEPNRWHKVTIDIDIQNQTYDVFFDDDTYAGNLQPLKYRNDKVTSVSAFGIAFQAASDTAGYLPVFIDDFEVRGK